MTGASGEATGAWVLIGCNTMGTVEVDAFTELRIEGRRNIDFFQPAAPLGATTRTR